MSRLQTQERLSGSPRIPSSTGGISPGSFTPVADNTAGEILGLVNSVVGTVGAVVQQNQRKTDEQLQQDYELTSANLIRLQQEAERDPTKQGVFLGSYNAAASRFSGTRYEAEIAGLGEGTKTSWFQQEQRKAQDVARGFLSTKVIPAAKDALTDPENRATLLAETDPSARRRAIQELIQASIPDSLPEYFQGEEGQRRLEEYILTQADGFNDVFQTMVENDLEQQEQVKQEIALNGAVVDLVGGLISYDEALEIGTRNNYTTFQTEREIAGAFGGAIATSALDGSAGTYLPGLLTQAENSLDKIQDQRVKAQLAGSITQGQQAYAQWAADGFVAEWEQTYRETGDVDAANLSVVESAYDLLGITPEDNATLDSITGRGFQGAFNKAVAQAAKDAMKRVGEISTKQKNIINFAKSGTGAGVDVDNMPTVNLVAYPEAAFEGLSSMTGTPAAGWEALYENNPELFYTNAGVAEMRTAANTNQTEGINAVYGVLSSRLLSNGPEFRWGVSALESLSDSELNAMFVDKDTDEVLAMQDLRSRIGTMPEDQLQRFYADRLAQYRDRDELETARFASESDYKDRKSAYEDGIKSSFKQHFKVEGQSVEFIDPLLVSRVAAYAYPHVASGVKRSDAVRYAMAQLNTEGYTYYTDGAGQLAAVYDPTRHTPEANGVSRVALTSKMLEEPTRGYAAVVAERITPGNQDLRVSIADVAVRQGYIPEEAKDTFLTSVVDKGFVSLSFGSVDRQDNSLALQATVGYIDEGNRFISYTLDLTGSDGTNVYRGSADAESIHSQGVVRSELEKSKSLMISEDAWKKLTAPKPTKTSTQQNMLEGIVSFE
jgi:hypothetical protein